MLLRVATSARRWIVVLGIGACSGDGEGGGASCAGEACEGDVTGTWSYVSSCGEGSLVENLDEEGCLQVTTTLDAVTTEGRLTLADGGAYGLDATIMTSFTGTGTVLCSEYAFDCVGTEGLWMSLYGEASCADDGIGGCSCSATLTEDVEVTGTWTSDAATVTVHDGVAETTYQSCADSKTDTLWLHTTFSDDFGEFTFSDALERAP